MGLGAWLSGTEVCERRHGTRFAAFEAVRFDHARTRIDAMSRTRTIGPTDRSKSRAGFERKGSALGVGLPDSDSNSMAIPPNAGFAPSIGGGVGGWESCRGAIVVDTS